MPKAKRKTPKKTPKTPTYDDDEEELSEEEVTLRSEDEDEEDHTPHTSGSPGTVEEVSTPVKPKTKETNEDKVTTTTIMHIVCPNPASMKNIGYSQESMREWYTKNRLWASQHAAHPKVQDKSAIFPDAKANETIRNFLREGGTEESLETTLELWNAIERICENKHSENKTAESYTKEARAFAEARMSDPPKSLMDIKIKLAAMIVEPTEDATLQELYLKELKMIEEDPKNITFLHSELAKAALFQIQKWDSELAKIIRNEAALLQHAPHTRRVTFYKTVLSEEKRQTQIQSIIDRIQDRIERNRVKSVKSDKAGNSKAPLKAPVVQDAKQKDDFVSKKNGGKPKVKGFTGKSGRTTGNCYTCDKPGHIARDCPTKQVVAAITADNE